ncbi:MAG: hypothetical protein ACI84C_001354 [Flavobacteriales bacterium]|jgi:hypothetical protein
MYHFIGKEFGYQWSCSMGDSVSSSNIDFGITKFQELRSDNNSTVYLQAADTCVQMRLTASDDEYAERYFESLERELVAKNGNERTWKLWHIDDTLSFWLIDIELSEKYTWPMLGFLKGVPIGIKGRRGAVDFAYSPQEVCELTSADTLKCKTDRIQLENIFPPTYFFGNNVSVMGNVIARIPGNDRMPIENVEIEIFKNDLLIEQVLVSDSGWYELLLPLDYKYLISYHADGYVDKSVEIDSRYIPVNARYASFEMHIEMSLFQEIPGVDFSILNQPIGKCNFDPSTNSLEFDFDYTRNVQDSLTILLGS